jgi:glycosyltransferase involved in cell wall biosynthesis
MKILILLPARNEEQSIGQILHRICTLYPDQAVVVVDDASHDTTAAIAKQFPAVSLIQLPFWMGYGGALQAGYKYAYRNAYDAVVQLDADGQHDPASIQTLIDKLSEADVVVGSRFLSHAYQMKPLRRAGCYFLSWFGKRLTGMKITDPTSGFQALNRKALGIAILDFYPMDYPDLDVLILMHRFHLKVTEVPVRMRPADGKAAGMHEGLQVWYYALKMMLSICVMMLRKS